MDNVEISGSYAGSPQPDSYTIFEHEIGGAVFSVGLDQGVLEYFIDGELAASQDLNSFVRLAAETGGGALIRAHPERQYSGVFWFGRQPFH